MMACPTPRDLSIDEIRAIVAGNYDRAKAEWGLSKGYADVAAFGRPFVANPDFPRRLAEDLPLASLDAGTLFGGSGRGYVDYPAWPDAGTQAQANETLDTEMADA